MKEHIQHCSKNKPTKIAYPTVNKRNIKFLKINALMENALVLYCQFESYLKPENKTEGNITHMSEHIVSGYCTYAQFRNMDWKKQRLVQSF